MPSLCCNSLLREYPESFPVTLRSNRSHGMDNSFTRSSSQQPPRDYMPNLEQGHTGFPMQYRPGPSNVRYFSGPSPLRGRVTDLATPLPNLSGSIYGVPLYKSPSSLPQSVHPNIPPSLGRRVNCLRGPPRSTSVPVLQDASAFIPSFSQRTPPEILSPIPSLLIRNFSAASSTHDNLSRYQTDPPLPQQQQNLHPDSRYTYSSTQPPQAPRYHHTGYPHPATAGPGDPILSTPNPDPLDPLLEEKYPSRYIPSHLRDAGSTPYHPPFTNLPDSGRRHGTRH